MSKEYTQEEEVKNEVTFFRPITWKLSFKMFWNYLKILFQASEEEVDIYCYKYKGNLRVLFYTITNYGMPVLYILRTDEVKGKLDNKMKEMLKITININQLFAAAEEIRAKNVKVEDFQVVFKWSKNHIKTLIQFDGKRYGISIDCQSEYKDPELHPKSLEILIRAGVNYSHIKKLEDVAEVVQEFSFSTASYKNDGPQILQVLYKGNYSEIETEGYATTLFTFKEQHDKDVPELQGYQINPLNLQNTLNFAPENFEDMKCVLGFGKQFLLFDLQKSDKESFTAVHFCKMNSQVKIASPMLP